MVYVARTGLTLVTYGRPMIDPDGPVPPYRQLADILRGQIEGGQFEPNRPIPSISQLQQTYHLARGTIVKAVGVLVDEGLVQVVPGRGVYVIARRGNES